MEKIYDCHDPKSFTQRRKKELGPLAVECQVSGRRLQFHTDSSLLHGGEFISVDVIAGTAADLKTPPKKICELIITREDLLEALAHVHPKD
jgi:hypothetical protein